MKNSRIRFLVVFIGLLLPARFQCKGLPQFVFVTPEYSNAVFRAVLPRFSDFARTLKLDVPLPLTDSQVERFQVNLDPNIVGGYLTLTNHYRMWFEWGIVHSFRTPRNYFEVQDFADLPKFYGPLRMSREEAVAMAKKTIADLGYKLEDVTHDWPMKLRGPVRQGTNVIPFYEVRWENPTNGFFTEVCIDGENRQIVGLFLDITRIRRPNPKIDVVPQIDTNYWKRRRDLARPPNNTNSPAAFSNQTKMFFRSNAPPRWGGGAIPQRVSQTNSTRLLTNAPPSFP